MPKMCKKCKGWDIFGHPVQLNLDKKGPSHKTCIGFIFSFLWFVVSIVVIAMCMGEMGKSVIVSQR
jgi:hypothetical protein